MSAAPKPLEPLTRRALERAKPRERDYFLWDGGHGSLRGFGCRVYPSGRKRFVVQYSQGPRGAARTFRFNLGDFPGLDVQDARREAGVLLDNARQGAKGRAPEKDPDAERRARREAAIARKRATRNALEAPTVADVVPRFLAAIEKRVKPKTYVEWARMLRREVVENDPLGALKVADVRARDVEAWHAAREDRPVLANHGLATLRLLFKFAAKRELRVGPVDMTDIPRHRVRPKTRRPLRAEQYAALGSALRTAEHDGLSPAPSAAGENERRRAKRAAQVGGRGPYERHTPVSGPSEASPWAVGFVRFLAVSGWRKSEALTLRRDAVDAERRVAVLDDSKSGRSVRPLGDTALAILDALPVIDSSPFYFPGQDAQAPMSEPRRLWRAVRHAAKVRVTLHGLRHAFITVARELGYSDHVIAHLVGHVVRGMTSRYGEVPESQIGEAAGRVSSLIAARLAGASGEVISIDAVRFTPRARRA